MFRTLVSWLLLACLLLPTGAKLVHAFEDHVRIDCHEDIPNHLHQAEFDCDFQKYQLATAFQTPEFLWEPVLITDAYSPGTLSILGVTTSSPRFFSLRAPPV